MTEVDDIALTEVPYGSDLYGKTLELREAILRKPLGLGPADWLPESAVGEEVPCCQGREGARR